MHLLVPGFAEQLEGLLLCGLGFGHSGQLGGMVQRPGHRGGMESGCLGRPCIKARAVMCLRSSLRINAPDRHRTTNICARTGNVSLPAHLALLMAVA